MVGEEAVGLRDPLTPLSSFVLLPRQAQHKATSYGSSQWSQAEAEGTQKTKLKEAMRSLWKDRDSAQAMMPLFYSVSMSSTFYLDFTHR